MLTSPSRSTFNITLYIKGRQFTAIPGLFVRAGVALPISLSAFLAQDRNTSAHFLGTAPSSPSVLHTTSFAALTAVREIRPSTIFTSSSSTDRNGSIYKAHSADGEAVTAELLG